MYSYYIDLKTQTSRRKLPNDQDPKKHAKFDRTLKFSHFSDYFGIVYNEFLPQGSTVNKLFEFVASAT